MQTALSIDTLERAAEWLYDYDPELVESGCADVSAILVEFAARVGLEGVKPVVGWAARADKARKGFPHVWLDVNGEWFDPVAHARGVTFKTYVEDAAVGSLAVDGSYLDFLASGNDLASDYSYVTDELVAALA